VSTLLTGQAEQSPGITLSEVRKNYESLDGDQVLGIAPVSLDIGAGEFVSFVGRSGCGKSTLLRMIAGLTAPSGGAVHVAGGVIRGPDKTVRYVFQNYGESLLPWKTVGDNVEFGLRHSLSPPPKSKQAHRAAIEHYLAEVGLHGVAARYPSELSGGMQQRVAIARALASSPTVLLLDEPFSAVDALSRANLQDLVLRLWEQHGLTVLFVTHDIDEALYLSDRVLVLGPAGTGIVADVDVALERPRDQVDTRESARYLSLRREVMEAVLA